MTDTRLLAAKAIIDFEARRDKNGHLMVYALPPNDGGGRFEVAGINERYNPAECAHLVELLGEKKYAEAELYAQEVIARDTDVAERWHQDPGVLFFLRDSIFNRGLHGAARILQRAVKVKDDGIVGPVTRAAIAKIDPDDLLVELREAREDYERHVVGYRANFWKGLVHRWDNALNVAQKMDVNTSVA
jgi:lysozyme family protein